MRSAYLLSIILAKKLNNKATRQGTLCSGTVKLKNYIGRGSD